MDRCVFVCLSDCGGLANGEPSYSYCYSGFYFAPQSEALVRWTAVRVFVNQIGQNGGTAFLQLLLRGVFGAPQSAALVPPKFTSGGYYSMLNSIDVRPSVRNPNWGLVDLWFIRGEEEPSYSYY